MARKWELDYKTKPSSPWCLPWSLIVVLLALRQHVSIKARDNTHELEAWITLQAVVTVSMDA